MKNTPSFITRIVPPNLKPGDTIAIAAPARFITPEELNPAVKIFESWGLKVLLHPLLFEQHHQFAGTDEIRAKVFNDYIYNSAVKAIVCARGGYGCVRIVDLIDFDFLQNNPKWIVGYSDITVLHSHINRNTNLCSLHATMPINMQPHNVDETSVALLKKVLFDTNTFDLSMSEHALNRPGKLSGELVGGNLSVLYSLLGSKSDLDTDGKILFLEDLDEYVYHIDRMMQALDRAGKLKNLAGLLVGGMTEMKDNQKPFGKTAEEIIAEVTVKYAYPVFFGISAGHIQHNFPLVFGHTFISKE